MSDETSEDLQPEGIDEVKEEEKKEVQPDEYAALKEDFSLVVQRGVQGFQEYAPGREIDHSIMRLQGRYGMLVETNDRGLISMPEMSGTVTDNQGKDKIQRMFIGLNCSSSTKATAFKSVNLLRRGETSIKEFEVNSASYDLLKKTIEQAQSKGEDVQRKIDEDDFKHFKRLTDESCEMMSTNLDAEGKIRPGHIFTLISLARQTLKKILGAKLDDCKIVFFSIADTCELADSQGGKADTVLPRTGFAIQAKTSKGNEVMRTIRGTGGMSALLRYRNQEETTPEIEIEQLAEAVAKDAIDMDRAQLAGILAGEAHVVLGPEVVGVLAHEVYGHTSEADIIIDNKHDKTSDLNLKQRIGGQVAVDPKFHMIDDGSRDIKLGDQVITNAYGGIVLDDDGIPGKRTYIIKKGIMRNAINSADTIGEIADGLPEDIKREMEEHGLTGNLRSERFDKEPMVRMTNTYILPDEEGPDSLKDLAAKIPGSKKGVYIASCSGGWVQPSTGDFQVTGQLGYLIENGMITDKPVKDIIIQGNINKFGSKIKAIGSSKTIKHTFTGYCGKDSQWVPVEAGGPALLVEDVMVGKTVPKWSWIEQCKEYGRQVEEVACGKRKRSEIYLRFLEEENTVIDKDEPEERIKHDHSDVCMVVGLLDPSDELRILLGEEPFHSEYTMGENGTLLEED